MQKKIYLVISAPKCYADFHQHNQIDVDLTLSFRSSLLWDTVDDGIKKASTLANFKMGSQNGMANRVTV